VDAAPGVQGLPAVNPVFIWVRLAQRILIRVELDDVPCPIVLSAGMTATVSIQDGPAGRADVHPQFECPARIGGSTGVRPTWLGLMVIQR
jgi:multidrug resistance efflux pump